MSGTPSELGSDLPPGVTLSTRQSGPAGRSTRAIWLILSSGEPAGRLQSHPPAAAARRACTSPVAHTAYPGHTPAASRRHDLISTNSIGLVTESPVADQIGCLADRVDFDVSPGFIGVDHIVVAEVNSDVMGVIAMGVMASEESQVARLRRTYPGHHGQFGIGVAATQDVTAVGQRVDPAGEAEAVDANGRAGLAWLRPRS